MKRRVAIVGAAGQLGSALVAELESVEWPVIALTRRSLDVTCDAAPRVLADLRPSVIINASAWNDVDGAEDNPAAALAVNRDGVARLAAAAEAIGATFIHYSSDFVFDGTVTRPYVETDEPSPVSRYGESKLAGERAAMKVQRHYVLRVASLFGGLSGPGTGGRVTIDRMIDAMRRGGEVRAFSDRTVSPSYVVDVAWATRCILETRPMPGIYHCVNSGFTTWYALACELRRLVDSAAPVVSVRAADVSTRARRPIFCALSNARLTAAGIILPTWWQALRRHVSRRLPHGTIGEATTVAGSSSW